MSDAMSDASSSACPPLTEVGEAQREPAPRTARNRPTAQGRANSSRAKPWLSMDKLAVVYAEYQSELQSLRAQQAALNAHHDALIAMECHQQELLQLGEGVDPPEGGRGSWSLVPKLLRPAADATLAAATSLGAHITGQVERFSARMKTVLSSVYLELFLQGVVTITEADMREFITACPTELIAARYSFTREVGVHLLDQFEAGTASRESMEATIQRFYFLKVTSMRIAMECRPDFLLLSVSNLTPPPDPALAAAGAADAEGASLARLHPSLHFIADLEWTDEQRDRLRPRWQLYNARIAAIRAQAQQNLDAARMDAVAALAVWESLLPDHPKGHRTSAEAYTRLVDSTSGVDAWLRLELVTSMELVVDFLGVLTAMQALKINKYSQPFIVDTRQVCAWLLD